MRLIKILLAGFAAILLVGTCSASDLEKEVRKLLLQPKTRVVKTEHGAIIQTAHPPEMGSQESRVTYTLVGSDGKFCGIFEDAFDVDEELLKISDE